MEPVDGNEHELTDPTYTLEYTGTGVAEPEQVANANSDVETGNQLTRADTGPPYSVFKPWQKKTIVFAASLGAVFSPMSTTIYLPALNTIASDLNVSNAKINLTVTTFLVSSSTFLKVQTKTDCCEGYAGSCAYAHCRIFRWCW